jgi:hypothetical protein
VTLATGRVPRNNAVGAALHLALDVHPTFFIACNLLVEGLALIVKTNLLLVK